MVGLQVGLEDVANGPPSSFGELEVLIEMIEVGVAHGELALPLSAKEIGCAARRGMEYLAENHASLRTYGLVLPSVGNPAAAHSG
jgi:hypothetical protein